MEAPALQDGGISPTQIRSWRERLAQGRVAIRQAFLADRRPQPMLAGHTRLVDDVLIGLWQQCALPESLSLVAVGGYGRGELYPYSDVDILILLPDTVEEGINRSIEQFIGALWDAGLELGHSVRSVDECVVEAKRDVTVRTALYETRCIAGNASRFERLRRELAQLDVASYFQAKVDELRARYARFQDTAYNLEPNVKESPGGLRDLQVIIWCARAAGFGSSWNELALDGLITPLEAKLIAKRESILQTLRIQLHYIAGRREDRLLFDFQTELANELKLSPKAHHRPSERLMEGYYRTTKTVGLLNTILMQNLAARILSRPDAPATEINTDFEARNRLLVARDETLYQRRPSAILETFLLLQQHTELEGIDAPTLRALWRAKNRINSEFRRDRVNQTLFMDILRQPKRVTFVLRKMNHYGVLGRYIPAFGRIVGQMQHDLFHVYTVDAHILMVVRNMRRFLVPQFTHEYPFCSELIQHFERPEVLVLACLFHDIAKGRGGDHSALGAVDARRFCRRHHLAGADTELVAWLVENHLHMSAVAQKQDISDPDVINAFTTKVGDERRLTALYLLTVADIRGTSPKVWNAWKGKLLEDLFRITRRVLSEGAASIAVEIAAKQREALRIVRSYALADSAHEKFWAKLDPSYFGRFDVQEIAWHTRVLAGRVDSPESIIKARLSPIGEGVQVLIYSPDQEALFARICGFFERMNYNVVDAKIYTTLHGYALDSFQILDQSKQPSHYRDLLAFIEFELGARLRTRAPLEEPIRGRVSRHLKHFPIEPEVSVRRDDKGVNWMLSIIGGDRAGLLSCVARIFIKHRVRLHHAKIITLGERAEDVFIVSGNVFNDPVEMKVLCADLTDCLKT
jgi:[protein-PII] uridylyltransferase